MPLHLRIKILTELSRMKRRQAYEATRRFLNDVLPTVLSRQASLRDGLRVRLPLKCCKENLQVHRFPTHDVEMKKSGRVTLWRLCGVCLHVRYKNKLVISQSLGVPDHLARVLRDITPVYKRQVLSMLAWFDEHGDLRHWKP